MPKRIIVLEKTTPNMFHVAFWVTTPAPRIAYHANASATSAYKQATAEELGALQDGSVVERVETVSVPPAATLPQMQAQLEGIWQTFQTALDNEATFTRYGTYWDGTTWTLGGA